jgi:sugar transferase (PEP-CTERM/EpsH1 system associated)
MTPLLLLAHRLPYPPNKGDKIRSYHLVRWLSQYFDIYLGTFYDDVNDEKFIGHLSFFTKETYALPLQINTFSKVKNGLLALVKGNAITIECFYSKSMQTWVNDIVSAKKITHNFVICSSMARYVMNDNLKFDNKIIDLMDLDSDKWLQYHKKFSGVMSLIYARESKKLFKFEMEIAKKFNSCVFVSQVELDLFNEKTEHKYKDSFFSIQNGIDSEYFSANQIVDNDLQGRHYLVFTGTMNAVSNVESILWFINTVWHNLRFFYPFLELLIVGNKPMDKVLHWDKKCGVTVTGTVPDVRPYLKYSIAAVAPMVLARGVQNKVLEAMAMEKSLVLTHKAAEGIHLSVQQREFVTDDSNEMLKFLSFLINHPDEAREIGKSNRQIVLNRYNWSKSLESINALFSNLKQ